jgi:hypothetical protein
MRRKRPDTGGFKDGISGPEPKKAG